MHAPHNRYGQVPLAEGRVELTNPPNASMLPLEGHGGPGPHLILRWNDMPTMPESLDIVVHLHGYANRRTLDREHLPYSELSLSRHKEGASGLDFHGPASSGGTPVPGRTAPTLAILPRGRFHPTRRAPAAYDFPALTGNADGLQYLIDFCFEYFLRHQLQASPGQTVRRGRLILTGHSGGGIALGRILELRDAQRAPRYNPDEVHVFDGLYTPKDPFLRWATQRIRDEQAGRAAPGALRVLYRDDSGTLANSQELDAALRPVLASAPEPLRDRYRVEQSGISHGEIPSVYGWRLLRDAGARDLPSLVTPRAPAMAHAASDTHHGSTLPYREAMENLEQARLDARMALDNWETRLGQAEAELNAGRIPRLPAKSLEELARLSWPYELIGRQDTYAEHRRRLEAALERIRAWIVDTSRSAVELITEAPGAQHYLRDVRWEHAGYPGNSDNAERNLNPSETEALFARMARLCPERRVPQLIRQLDIDAFVQRVSGQPGKSLFPAAREAFERMQAAAAQNSVTLTILSAWRDAGSQQQVANSNTNRRAAGGQRSAHRYGLAVDLAMAVSGLNIHGHETNTHHMADLFAMYRSPAYKWMYVNGESHGFFPYASEPWHWEYNPVGFPDEFPTLVAELRRRAA